jgi:uncharacterized membrane protein
MQAFSQLLAEHPLVFFHLVTAFSALVIGIVVMLRRKGTFDHRLLGWTWVVLMASTAIASAFIRDDKVPNLFGFTPIHAFTLIVAYNLPLAVLHIRRGNVVAHQKRMRGLFKGACVVAFVFTLLPGRFLGHLLWSSLGLMA